MRRHHVRPQRRHPPKYVGRSRQAQAPLTVRRGPRLRRPRRLKLHQRWRPHVLPIVLAIFVMVTASNGVAKALETAWGMAYQLAFGRVHLAPLSVELTSAPGQR